MPFLLDRARLARWALVYALFVIYGSVVVGPIGFHIVARDPWAVWRQFLTVHFIHTGSDQRPDWIANLLMLVPFGFLLAGALTPTDGRLHGAGYGRGRRVAAAGAAFVLAFAFVLAVKYAQLFVPGRTVTLNYITAQGIGAFLGVAAFALGREALVVRLLYPLAAGGRAGLAALLGAYAFLLLYFLLMPFDVALSAGDWHERLAALPHLLTALPSPGRATAVRAVLVLAAGAAFAPVGALLALAFPRRRLGWFGAAGVALALGVTVLTLPILSATPMLVSIPYRAAGVLAGAACWRALRPRGLGRAQAWLVRGVKFLVLPYLLLLAEVNGLLTPHWRTPAQALAALDWNGLIPLWHDYIVPKADAAKSTVVHVAMYAPIGAMVWLRFGGGRRQAFAAGVAAGIASLAVELGRWMKPGLQPDFNEVVIGGLAAWLAVTWAPRVWRLLLDAVAEAHSGVPGEGGRGAPSAAPFAVPSHPLSPVPSPLPSPVPSPVPSWPGLTRPSAHERSGVDGRVKPGHDGMGSRTADGRELGSGTADGDGLTSGTADGDELASGTADGHDGMGWGTADGDELGSGTAYRDGRGSGAADGDELRSGLAPGDRPGWLAARAAVALVCLGALGWFLARYPLPPAPLAAVLAIYAAALWRWPGLWLVVVPAVLPAFDLTMWTGWLMASESDAFLLVTLGVLALRAPPARRDLWPRGVAGAVLALAALALGVGVLRGLTSSYVLPHGSADPYLLPINALRLAKGEVWAFVLLPFLRARERQAGDALVRLGWGMVAGLAAVAVAGIVERAVFPGVFNFHSFYRIAATFSSVQFGSDDIGTYLAMTLPFLVVFLVRPGLLRAAAGAVVALGGGYALLVTYSRTAYGAAVLGAVVTLVLLWPLARGRRLGAAVVGIGMFGLLAGTTVAFAVDSRVMAARLATVLPDFRARLDNWTGGLAMMDRTPGALLLGMGLGTYPRVARARAPLALQPSNDMLRPGDGRTYLRIESGSHFYFGQKVPVRPGRMYRLSLWFREASPGAHLGVVLCEKLLLYSEACNPAALPAGPVGVWRHAAVPLSSVGLDRRVVLGFLRRPIELALFATGPGETVDFTDVKLLDRGGRNLVRNGAFRRGTERWYPTDDSHLAWTIWNQYAIALFEGGALGLAAYLLLGAVALAGAVRAALRGVPMAAAVAGSLVAFLAAGVFDDELAAPRMVTLFYVVALVAISCRAKAR